MSLVQLSENIGHACTLKKRNWQENLSLRERLRTRWLDLVCISADSPLSRNYFKSNEEIRIEKEKQIKSRHPYYIHPLSKFRAMYEVYLIFFISLMIFSKLAEHGFTQMESEFFPKHREVSVFLDLLCLLDIAMNFFTGYVTNRGLVEMDPRKIARNYALGPYFICDLLSATPRQIWYIIMTEKQVMEDRMLCFLGVINILCCFRYSFEEMTDMLLIYGEAKNNGRQAVRLYEQKFPNRRIPHHSTFASIEMRLRETGNLRTKRNNAGRPRTTRTVRIEEAILTNILERPSLSTRTIGKSINLTRILLEIEVISPEMINNSIRSFQDKLDYCQGADVCSVIITLLLLHFFTCMQYGVSRTVRIYFVTVKDRRYDSWIYTNNLYYQSFYVRYLHGFFKSSAYLLGIKLKFYEHKLPEEYALAIITYTTGKILLAIVWEIINQVSCYMNQRGVPNSLRNRMMQFYNFLYRKEYFKENDVSAVLPARLKDEVNIHMCYWLIENVQLFESLSKMEVNEVVSKLRPQIYLPKDYITTANSPADAMYFISDGTVAMVTPTPVATLSELFGRPTDSSKDNMILERLKALAVQHLPQGWKEWTLAATDRDDVLEDPIDSQILNKIRFALPTVGIARAFNPMISSLSEKTYWDMKLCHMDDGQYFGELGLLMKTDKYALTVIAIEITKVYMLPKKDFYTILLKNAGVAAKISEQARRFAKIIEVEEYKYKKMKFKEAFKARKTSEH
nr:unnamed protein product [Callosobruchus analis]